MTQPFLTKHLIQYWSRMLTLRQYSPFATYHSGDMVIVDPTDPPLIILVDISPGPGSTAGFRPRRRFAEILARTWPAMRACPPSDALMVLGNALRDSNRSETTARLFCSAVLCAQGTQSNTWQLSEAGDAKVFIFDGNHGQAVWGEGMPKSTHQVEGALGMSNPKIRSTTISLEGEQHFLFLTDGAFWILSAARVINEHGIIDGKVVDTLEKNSNHLEDDATLLVFNPHQHKRDIQ